ncbi:dihydrolipoyl dehydrogenase [Spiroplasma endosymbiont of Anurida maritima]|uniref:dihydrolipoyl dehydrogenase n=1 Tax=Spiroplasma endosymbiont of Anurida maritima TaxID=2967972 RepID=UPI0036D3D78F
MKDFKFADIGEGLTEGTVGEVFVKVGDKVDEFDPLFSVETDKVTEEITSIDAGIVGEVLIKPGQVIKVGETVVRIKTGDSASSAPAKTEEKAEEGSSVIGAVPVSNNLIPARGVKTSSAPAKSAPKTTIDPNQTFDYDLIVVGAGPGGYVAAIRAAQSNLKTLIIEKEYFGGVCLNVGCIPTKALLKSSKVYDLINHADKYGIDITGTKAFAPNWEKMMARKDDVVTTLTKGVQALLNANKVKIVKGTAVGVDAHTVKVGSKNYTTKNMILATGSIARRIKTPNFEKAFKDGYVITSTEALALPKIPKKLVVVGGGVIGVEFAALYSKLGTEVTILQGLSTILEMLDKDVISVMEKVIKDSGIKIITNANVKDIKGKSVVYEVNGKEAKITSDYCLVSIGRESIVEGFESIGLNIGERKNFIIDDACKTNIPSIYAIGDATGRSMLAHTASAQGICAVENILGKNTTVNYNRIPSCIYTSPEVASVGFTEEQIKDKKIEYTKFKFPLAANGKSLADGDTVGFVKILAEKKYGEILGAHIIGSTATDMISEITAVMETEGTIDDLGSTIHPHPTLSEAVMETAHGLSGHAIHVKS